MSIFHRAEPLCAGVVSSLWEGVLSGTDKGSMSGGAQRHTGEAVASKKLPVVLLSLSPSDLPRVATPWAAAAAGASLCLYLTLSLCPVHQRCLLSRPTAPGSAALGSREGSRSKQAHTRVSSACLCAESLWDQEDCCATQRLLEYRCLPSFASPPSLPPLFLALGS